MTYTCVGFQLFMVSVVHFTSKDIASPAKKVLVRYQVLYIRKSQMRRMHWWEKSLENYMQPLLLVEFQVFVLFLPVWGWKKLVNGEYFKGNYMQIPDETLSLLWNQDRQNVWLSWVQQ